MTVLARGSKQVKDLERAIGGMPPKVSKESQTWLRNHLSEGFKNRQAGLAESSRLADELRQSLFSTVSKDDAGLKKLKNEIRASRERRKVRKVPKPKPLKIEPRFMVGSNILVKVPPYDGAWQWQSRTGPNCIAQSDPGGTCSLSVGAPGDGSTIEAAAGFFTWFFSPEDNPMQRFAAVVQYSDDWWDSAYGYVAYNNMRTRLWVWGQTENAWVVQSDESPSWSDAVSWFASHGNDPSGDSGNISNETFFPAMANSWYQAWVWSDAWVYADGGFWGSAASSIIFSSLVPLIVFGSL